MSSNYLTVHDATHLKVSSSFVPGYLPWEPGDESEESGGTVIVGVRKGDRVRLNGTGPNDDAILTIEKAENVSGTMMITVYETLSTPDTNDYEFYIGRVSSRVS